MLFGSGEINLESRPEKELLTKLSIAIVISIILFIGSLPRRTWGLVRIRPKKVVVLRLSFWAMYSERTKITDNRKDHLHKLTTQLVRENQTIVVENLAVKNMVKNPKLSQAISDVSWGEITRQLAYKCRWYGRNYIDQGNDINLHILLNAVLIMP